MKTKKLSKRAVVGIVILMAALLVGIFLIKPVETGVTLPELMRDAVLHEEDRVNFLGIKAVNPALISSFVLTAALLLIAGALRIFVIPKFKYVPGKLQILLEKLVDYFDSLAKTNSPHKNGFLGAYAFAAGVYIFLGTLMELFGIQVIAVSGASVRLPAPLADINGAIALGCLSYCVILSGGVIANGTRGIGRALKEFSLPISMSFRLFGALLSGLLVTELVYSVIFLSFVLPVVVAVLFTLLHALIQTYVLTLLTCVFYGEVTEPPEKKEKKKKKRIAKGDIEAESLGG
ncbi:MAG: F0F1 ATP synthase subunit A [Oscillospiraceae bacterium]|jgi:F-type H+-transporting ATPase subunit a|nr:F0F1 ATP synthase subunit A [Oscillospiraceae bacterium]